MKKIILLIILTQASFAGHQSYFSPQTDLLAIITDHLKQAKQSIDISIYSFRNEKIRTILVEKLKSGVAIRMVINGGKNASIRNFVRPITENGGDVRYVSKINHHKFLIIDQEVLINSSGNLTGTALSQSYDENMVICDECNLRIASYQKEFDEIHQYGSPVNPDYAVIFPLTTQTAIPTKELNQALFTSSNFIPYYRNGQISFKKVEIPHVIAGNVDSSLINAIDSAQQTIHIATGHFRSKPLYEALIRAMNRGVIVNIVLDGQEYISYSAQNRENKKVSNCMDKYNDYVKCYKSGLHFSRLLAQNGAKLRFKYYMLRWFFPMAPQMHHKYMIIDKETLFSGSYNWSYNAEFESFENVGIYTTPSVVKSFLENFSYVNNYGDGNRGYLAQLKKWEQSDNQIETVFEPISLTLKQVDSLRSAAYKHCNNLYQNAVEDRVCFTKK